MPGPSCGDNDKTGASSQKFPVREILRSYSADQPTIREFIRVRSRAHGTTGTG